MTIWQLLNPLGNKARLEVGRGVGAEEKTVRGRQNLFGLKKKKLKDLFALVPMKEYF